jgi:hypothetical protein
MNFIAGFLYLLFGDEALAFAVMRESISRFKMSQLFNTELPMLKLNFYQLDRLIAILLPDLHSHFRVSVLNYLVTILYRMKQLILVIIVLLTLLLYLQVLCKCKLVVIIVKNSEDSGTTSLL